MNPVPREEFIEVYTVNLIEYYNSPDFVNFAMKPTNNSLDFIKRILTILTTRVRNANTNFRPLAKTLEQLGVDRTHLLTMFQNEKT